MKTSEIRKTLTKLGFKCDPRTNHEYWTYDGIDYKVVLSRGNTGNSPENIRVIKNIIKKVKNLNDTKTSKLSKRIV